MKYAERKAFAIQDVGASIDLISRGGEAGKAGVINVTRIAKTQISELVESRPIRNLFIGIAQKFYGKTETATAVGLAARLGIMQVIKQISGIGAAAYFGWELGTKVRQSFEAAQEAKNKSQGISFDLAKQYKVDFTRQRESGNAATVEALQSRSATSKFTDWILSGETTGYSAHTWERIQKQKEFRSQLADAKRQSLENREQVIALAASERGKSTAEMTEWEKQTALDAAVDKSEVWSWGVRDQVAAELTKERQRTLFPVSPETRRDIANKVLLQFAKRNTEMRKDIIARGILDLSNMSASDIFTHRQENEQVRARYDQHRNRHRAWADVELRID